MKNLISYFFTIIPLIVFSQSEKITNGNFESGLRLWTNTGTSVNIPSDVNNSFLFGDQTTALSHHSNDILNQTTFTIIPNPATKESIFCRFEYLTSGNPTYFNYEIINSTGIVISQESGIEYQNPIGGIYITNINSLSMGLYTIRVFDEENNFHSKLIISHD